MTTLKTKSGWVLASPDGKRFLVHGTGNTEHDGDWVTDSLQQATIFTEDPSLRPFEYYVKKGGKLDVRGRYPVSYYLSHPPLAGERKLGNFMQTAIGMQIEITLHVPKFKVKEHA